MSFTSKKRVNRDNFRKASSDALLYIFLGIFALVVVLPYLWMLFTSFKPSEEVFTTHMQLLPIKWTLTNFSEVLSQKTFIHSIFNSVIVTTLGVLFEVTIAFIGAYAFAKIDFYGKDILFMIILGTLMIPPQVLMLPSYLLMGDLDWLNSYKGLIIPRAGAAFGIFLLRQFFMSVPGDLDDAAQMDGAGIIRRMISIYLPICLPSVVTVGIFSMLGFWNDYYWPLVIISDSKIRTVALSIAQFKNLEGMGNWELIMAASILATLPMLIIYIFARKSLINNITAGAISGQ
jgi:ABC-type glycerol-3-phosphate transport system permease component